VGKVVTLKSKMRVVYQMVVLDAGLAHRFETKVKELGISKSDAVNTALNIWMNMIDRPKEEEVENNGMD